MVRLDEYRAMVYPGSGLVARFGEAVVVTFPDDAEDGPVARRILEIVEAEANGALRAPGRRIARRLAALLSESEADHPPSFALVAQADPGVVIFLAGAVEVELTGHQGAQRLSGHDVASWVDRLIDAPFTLITVVGGDPSRAEPDARSDLRLGVVAGRGVALSPRAAPLDHEEESDITMVHQLVHAPGDGRGAIGAPPDLPPPPVAGPPEEPATDFVVVSLDEAPPARPPLPAAGAAASDAAPEDTPPGDMLRGIVCSRNHFNDPSALYCALCGISMVHQTHNLVEGPRPPLGFLVLDDGATFVLDSDYIIGREPENDPSVQQALARPLTVADAERSVSRIHARISLDGWNVRIADASSANGTYVAGPGEDTWTRLAPEELRTIWPGTRVLVGQRPLVFESHHLGAPEGR